MSSVKSPIVFDLKAQRIDTLLQYLNELTQNMQPAMAGIASELLRITEDNFAKEGQPAWVALSDARVAQRKKTQRDGKILQDKGLLAGALTTKSNETSAMVGVGNTIPYAAAHQFGYAPRNLPARPFLPMIKSSSGGIELQPEAKESIIEMLEDFLENNFKKIAERK